MFIEKGYVLGNDIAEKSNYHIANISALLKYSEEQDSDFALKLGNCVYIKRNYIHFGRTLKNVLQNNADELINMDYLLPVSYVSEELGINSLLLTKIPQNEYNFNVNIKKLKFKNIKSKDKITECSKSFLEFNSEFVDKYRKCVFYILQKDELQELKQDLKGVLALNKKLFLVWY